MKKNLFRTFLFVGALALMSFDEAGYSASGGRRRPMFGGRDECMSSIHWPNGDCTRECRHHTYIFWIDFVGDWETTSC